MRYSQVLSKSGGKQSEENVETVPMASMVDIPIDILGYHTAQTRYGERYILHARELQNMFKPVNIWCGSKPVIEAVTKFFEEFPDEILEQVVIVQRTGKNGQRYYDLEAHDMLDYDSPDLD